MGQVRHVVNASSVLLSNYTEAIAKVFILNHKLKVSLHRILVLLTHWEQVLSKLHIADKHFFDYADACNQTVLRVRRCYWAGLITKLRHCHAELVPYLILHSVELCLCNAEINLTLSWRFTLLIKLALSSNIRIRWGCTHIVSMLTCCGHVKRICLTCIRMISLGCLFATYVSITQLRKPAWLTVFERSTCGVLFWGWHLWWNEVFDINWIN